MWQNTSFRDRLSRLLAWWRSTSLAIRSAVFYSAIFLIWEVFTQALASRQLLLIDLGCSVAAYLALRWVARKGPPSRWQVILVAWLLVSFLSPVLERPLARHPERFAAPRSMGTTLAALDVAWPDQRIGLALSGGGYRAAVYHAGVLYELEQLGIHVTNLSVVSGGALIGSYYAAGGAPEDFAVAVGEGRFNLRRQLALAQNALRLPFPARVPGLGLRLPPFFDFSRVDVQSDLIRRLLLGQNDERMDRSCERCPRLLVNATDLRYGVMVGMLEEGLVLHLPGSWEEFYRERATMAWSRPFDLAERVAVSGAFPGAFPARRVRVAIPRGRPPEATASRVERELILADGGIGDNSGLRLMETTATLAKIRREPGDSFDPARHLDPEWMIDAMIVSNASALFGVEADLTGLGELTRAVDLIAQQNLVTALARRPSSPALTASRLSAGSSEEQATHPASDGPDAKALDNGPIVIGPQGSLDQLDRVFTSAPDGEANRSRINTRFVPLYYPTPILAALVEILPAGSREDAELAFRDLSRARSELMTLPNSGTIIRQASVAARYVNAATCGDQGASETRAACASARLRRLVGQDFEHSVTLFASTSTLDDQLGEELADALFRLGRSEVLIAWPRLRLALLHESRFPPDSQVQAIAQGLRLPIRAAEPPLASDEGEPK